MIRKNQAFSQQESVALLMGIFLIALSIVTMVAVSISLFGEDSPEDLLRVSVSFSDYEIRNHTKSSSYDLLLISEEHELPFKMNFFDAYRGIIYPEKLCSGSVYSMEVLPAKSSYVIYSCYDEGGNLILSKRRAYLASQKTAGIMALVTSAACICVGGLYIVVAFRPEWLSEKMRKNLMGTWGK